MIVQFVKFKTSLSEDQVMKVARERESQFKALSGLVQKYYVKLNEPDQYGGIYIWDSKESMLAFRETELAATIPDAYHVVGAPDIEVSDVLFTLKE